MQLFNKPCANLCVPVVAKNINIKMFNLMSSTNETCHVSRHECCSSKCRLDPSVCNNRQDWNSDKCSSEWKELIDKGRWDDELWWGILVRVNVNMINHVMKHLDYKKCKCRRKLIDKLVLIWEDEILNTNEISFDGKKIPYKNVALFIPFHW